MNGRHPIDDLFARGLREAEATPPPAVWEGIVRGRERDPRGWARLRRYRGAGLLALLLLGGAAAYQTLTPTGDVPPGPEQAPAPPTATVREAGRMPVTDPRAQTEPAVHPSAKGSTKDQPQESPVPSGTALASDQALASQGSAPVRSGTSISMTDASERPTSTAVNHGAHTRSSDPGAQPDHQATAFASGESTNSPDRTPAAVRSTATEHLAAQVPSSTVAVTAPTAAPFVRPADPLDVAPTRLPRLFPALPRPAGELLPTGRSAAPYVLPNADWWVAAQAGYYSESRTWKGTDSRLAEGLNSTERAHAPWGLGLLGGRSYRSGWGFCSGVEYVSAQYDFRHEDRIIARSETVTSIVVTLNAEVLDTYTDTVVTIEEERRQVEAINRYSIVRVPLEGSYHQGWRRWTYGVRAGLAAEFLTMRSGLTLADVGEEGSAYSVGVEQDPGRTRNATMLSATVGLDLGYSLTEQWGLWLTPTYSRGVAPLGEHDLYALPERAGFRLRLSYTLPHR